MFNFVIHDQQSNDFICLTLDEKTIIRSFEKKMHEITPNDIELRNLINVIRFNPQKVAFKISETGFQQWYSFSKLLSYQLDDKGHVKYQSGLLHNNEFMEFNLKE